MHFVVPPAYALCLCSCVFERPNLKHLKKSNLTPPLGLRILPLFEDPQIGSDVADDVIVSDIPPWSQSETQICLSLEKFKKDCTTPEIHKQAFLQIAPKTLFTFLPTGPKSMRWLLLQRCHLLPQ